MFLKILTTRRYNQQVSRAESRGQNAGYARAIEAVRQAFKNVKDIYLEPVTMIGNDQVVKDSVFLGCHPTGIEIKGDANGVAIEGICAEMAGDFAIDGGWMPLPEPPKG